MVITPAEPLIFSAGSALSRFSGFFYQCCMIPLLLALPTLSLSAGDLSRPGRTVLRVLGTLAVTAALYFLCMPAVGDFMQIGIVSHVLLMAAVILYAAFFCPLPVQERVVLTAAILADINFAQSISTQILMPILPLGVSNLLQFLILLAALAVTYIFRPSGSEERIPAAYWLSMLLVAVLSAVCLYAVRVLDGRTPYVDRAGWLTVAIILSAFFTVYLLMYYLYFVLVREHRTSGDLKAVQEKLTRDLESYRRSEAAAREYRGLRRQGNAFTAPGADGQVYSFAPEELVYIEAAGKNQKAVAARRKGPILLRSSMQALDNELAGSGFIRIHKGFLVNYRYIKKITSRSVLLDTGDDLPVGRDRLNAARERYLSLMKWNGPGC